MRPRIVGLGCGAPLEEVGDAVVHLAASDGHDPVYTVRRPAVAALFQPVDDGSASALDDAGTTRDVAPAVLVVPHPVEVCSAIAYEIPNGAH